MSFDSNFVSLSELIFFYISNFPPPLLCFLLRSKSSNQSFQMSEKRMFKAF